MGQPGWSNVQSFPHESIVRVKETRGTETSKYPEEEKETSISQVAASERERGQTRSLLLGLWKHVKRRMDSRIGLESPIAEGKDPVGEIQRARVLIQSRTGHVEPDLKPGGPPPKPKYYPVTDSA